MAKYWRTEVLTTCALDYMEWQNHYPEGIEEIGDTVVRRFPVDQPRDVPSFNSLSADLAGRRATATLAEQEQWMRAQGPVSTSLLQYLESERESYDAFIFFGYLYATTYFGLPIVKDRAFLAPLAHDEWPIYFRMWDSLFSLPRGYFFNTAEERQFLRRRFPFLELSGPVVGIGIEAPSGLEPEKFRKHYGLSEPFLLYVGRIDASKGCAELFDAFIRLRDSNQITHQLVLIGKEVLPVPYHEGLVYLGVLSEQEKWNGLAACDWLLVPSPYESLSMVLLEAWAAGRPALVTAASEVLVGHCERSNGGLWFHNYEECGAIIRTVDEATKARLGQQGQSYVRNNYSWNSIESVFLKTVTSVKQPVRDYLEAWPKVEPEVARRIT
jgi:glycosyltransferase involved in cell wall biosynthesis